VCIALLYGRISPFGIQQRNHSDHAGQYRYGAACNYQHITVVDACRDKK
jgi:hypothetical protein